MQQRKVTIIGSGPAGYTAGIYTARADLKPLIFEGYQPGGQLTITTEVENYPGFPQGINGPDLMNAMRAQTEKFGAEIMQESVNEVDFSRKPFYIKGDETEVESDTVIIATGASTRWLNIPSEKKLMGYGISACATCDGFFYRDKKVLVIGGGDSAMEEATFLTKFASQVKVVHRREELRASKIMQDKAFNNPKIDFIWNSTIEEYLGEPGKGLTGVKLRNLKTGEITKEKCDGVFLAIGHTPNTSIFKGKIEMDGEGYIIIKPGTTHTSIPGVFAAGDVHDKRYKQAVTAAGSGCMAAIDAEKYLEANG
ncbi:thioredoxin-disulfide reductase [bacterium]|nr:thioredoxin-disulfide reductase [FCB group bacterium]MBL7190910.1 thioredoxin-disulfide reductase [bacterium]